MRCVGGRKVLQNLQATVNIFCFILSVMREQWRVLELHDLAEVLR